MMDGSVSSSSIAQTGKAEVNTLARYALFSSSVSVSISKIDMFACCIASAHLT